MPDVAEYPASQVHLPLILWRRTASKITAAFVNKARTAYTGLFQHLERAKAKLLRKTAAKKNNLADCVVAAHQKLVSYYSKTCGAGGDIYN
jgi:hypothetical protein